MCGPLRSSLKRRYENKPGTDETSPFFSANNGVSPVCPRFIQLLAPRRWRLPHSPRFSASGHHGPIEHGASHLTLRNSADLHLRFLCFVGQHWSLLSQSVMTVTAPVPLFRRQHQTADNRIAMHVTQLLHPLVLREHDEIVEAMLPNVSLGKRNLPQEALLWINSGSTPSQQLPRERLFQGPSSPPRNRRAPVR